MPLAKALHPYSDPVEPSALDPAAFVRSVIDPLGGVDLDIPLRPRQRDITYPWRIDLLDESEGEEASGA